MLVSPKKVAVPLARVPLAAVFSMPEADAQTYICRT